MKIPIAEIISNRTGFQDDDQICEMTELVPKELDGAWRIVLGYTIYPVWHPVMVHKHPFQSKEKAEDLVDRILDTKEINLEHWGSYRDPNQPELNLGEEAA